MGSKSFRTGETGFRGFWCGLVHLITWARVVSSLHSLFMSHVGCWSSFWYAGFPGLFCGDVLTCFGVLFLASGLCLLGWFIIWGVWHCFARWVEGCIYTDHLRPICRYATVSCSELQKIDMDPHTRADTLYSLSRLYPVSCLMEIPRDTPTYVVSIEGGRHIWLSLANHRAVRQRRQKAWPGDPQR